MGANLPELVPPPPPPDWTVESQVKHLAEFRAQQLAALKRQRAIELQRQRLAELAQQRAVEIAQREAIVPPRGTGPEAVSPRDSEVATSRKDTVARPRRVRWSDAVFVCAVALLCVALGSWQSYWSLRATVAGREFLDRTGSFIDHVAVSPLEL